MATKKNEVEKVAPRLSVIVTCYNNADTLPKCLDALIGQTERNIEIVCVNDGSTDKTLDVLKKYAKKDARITIVDNKSNAGVSKTRNDGIEASSAEYIMFCDGDDYYDEQMCEKMLRAIDESGADLAISEIKITYEAFENMRSSDEQYYSLKYAGLQDISDELVQKTDLSPVNKIFRREKLDAFKIRFPEGLHYEDAYFCSAYFCASSTIYFLNEKLYNYIRRAHSTMSDTWDSASANDTAIEHLLIAFELYYFLEKNNLLESHNSLFWDLFCAFEWFAINNSKTSARRKEVRAKAMAFINLHTESFNKLSEAQKDNILATNKSNLRLYKTKTKRFLLRLMPTYRMQISNVERLRSLTNSSRQLNDSVERLSWKIEEKK